MGRKQPEEQAPSGTQGKIAECGSLRVAPAPTKNALGRTLNLWICIQLSSPVGFGLAVYLSVSPD